MTDLDTLDTLKRLIVGKRGRARADRLVVTSADGAQRTITVKPQKNASTYVDLVDACAPVRIEAFAGNDLVGAWGEPPAPRAPRAPNRPKPPQKNAKSAASAPAPKKKRPDMAIVVQLTTHMNTLLSAAYRSAAERDKALWESLAAIAQHHADRAGNAELRNELALKSVRVRDKAINERDALILRLNAKIAEVAAATGEDKKTEAFMQLLGIARGENPMARAVAAGAAAANGAKKAKVS
jgi:hypothetical protein